MTSLSAENQNALEALLTGIEANENQLGIFIAVCDDPQLKREIIERYEQVLEPTFRCYRLMLDREEPRLKGLIDAQVKADESLQIGDAAVMTILGSERLFSLRLGEEQSQQEKFFGYLQWTREGLQDYPFAIVLWVTYQMQERLGRKAPDFWSWRQDVVRFVSPKRSAIPAEGLELGEDSGLVLPGELGNSLPVEDLEALIADTERRNPKSKLLASLHAQAGKAYAERLRDGAAYDYGQEVSNAIRHLETATCTHSLSEDTEDYASNAAWLAFLYEGQGRYEEAEPLYLKASEILRKLLGEEHPNVATSLNNLADLYKNQGRYEEAEPLYQQALELRRKLLGEEHPNVATSLNSLAGLYKNQGRYEEAEPLYQQALELRRKLLGEEHPNVATSLNNLGALYFTLKNYKKAEPLFVSALSAYEKALPVAHPYTIGTRQWLEMTRSHLTPSEAKESVGGSDLDS